MSGSVPWSQRINEIRALAGTIPSAQIVERLGISRANLSYLCSLHNISLRVQKTPKPEQPVKKQRGAGTRKSRPELSDDQLPQVQQMLETEPVKSIARQLGVTVPQLYAFAARHDIKCRRKAGAGQTVPAASSRPNTDQLEACSRILRAAGYTVLLPCPFRNHVDRGRLTGSLPRE